MDDDRLVPDSTEPPAGTPGRRDVKRLSAILAADMVSYTRLMGADEHATEAALEAAHALFAENISSCGGRAIHMEGDSVLAVFASATGALDAALAVQDRLNALAESIPEARRVYFRVGLHIGDITEKVDGKVYGDGVNIAARIQSLAEPGGVWVSDAVQAAVRDRAVVTFADEGEKSVKNIVQPLRVFRVVRGGDGSAEQARRAWTPAVPLRTNLPFLDEALIGRKDDIAALEPLVSANRLVTIVGAAGIGKTRLAYDLAGRRVGQHEHGVWLVDLAPLASPEKIAPAIANAANLQLGEGDAVEMLARALGLRDTLLVLDNCEHLVAVLANVVTALLHRAPRVRVIATSQEALNASGEYCYRLDGLAVPLSDASLEAARDFGALKLLETRARAVDRHFAITAANLGEAIELCHRLDGIALAIEMAAARLPLLGLRGIRLRLDQRLQLLRTTDREAPARHQTLRAMLDDSYALLQPMEQAMLQRLAVFVGKFRLEMALEVAASTGIDEWTALDALAALVDKSLLQIHGAEPRRYRLLESTRLYAWEQLAASGQLPTALAQHGAAMAALAGDVERNFWGMPDEAWLDRYSADYDDLQAAFDRAAGRRDTSVAAPTGNALLRLDHLRNVNPVLRARAETAYALIDAAGVGDAALLWNCVAPHGLIAIDAVPRFTAAQKAVAAWRTAGSAPDLYLALGFMGYQHAKVGDHAASAQALAEAAELEDSSWPPRRRMRHAAVAAGAAIHRQDAAAYRDASRRELALAEEGGHDRAAAWARLKLADAALMAGDRADAISLGLAAVAQLDALDQPSNLGLALSNLCTALLMDGDFEGAGAAARRAFPLMWQNDWGFLLLDQLALIASHAGRHETAARILGFTDAWLKANHDGRQPNEARLVEVATALIDTALGGGETVRLRSEGGAMTRAQVEALVHAMLGQAG